MNLGPGRLASRAILILAWTTFILNNWDNARIKL
jgi:hypothetical protein